MGRGCYAGQPHSFACAKCRRNHAFYNTSTKRTSTTIGRRFTTTGRSRPQLSQGMNYHGWSDTAYEYACLDCHHIGWSRHPSVERMYKRQHGDQ